MPPRRPLRSWRRACVVRARTAAAEIRLLDLAIEPAFPEFGPGAVLDVIVEEGGITSIHSHVSMPIGPGLVRISLRRGRNPRPGMRFLWSLVEGATITVSCRGSSCCATSLSDHAESGRVEGFAAAISVLPQRS